MSPFPIVFPPRSSVEGNQWKILVIASTKLWTKTKLPGCFTTWPLFIGGSKVRNASHCSPMAFVWRIAELCVVETGLVKSFSFRGDWVKLNFHRGDWVKLNFHWLLSTDYLTLNPFLSYAHLVLPSLHLLPSLFQEIPTSPSSAFADLFTFLLVNARTWRCSTSPTSFTAADSLPRQPSFCTPRSTTPRLDRCWDELSHALALRKNESTY